jgi:hypothetical protein
MTGLSGSGVRLSHNGASSHQLKACTKLAVGRQWLLSNGQDTWMHGNGRTQATCASGQPEKRPAKG